MLRFGNWKRRLMMWINISETAGNCLIGEHTPGGGIREPEMQPPNRCTSTSNLSAQASSKRWWSAYSDENMPPEGLLELWLHLLNLCPSVEHGLH
uniref:Uncharacterized protein n=1 Tax=Triticum urartu TaxID=4572 RepID=A0A8R7QZ14_TRIUA